VAATKLQEAQLSACHS